MGTDSGDERPFPVAVVQMGATVFDTAATLIRVMDRIREAAHRGARIVVLPEAVLGGYPKGLDFGVRVGSRDPAGRALFQRYWVAAIDVPGAESEALRALAGELEIAVVVGAVVRVDRTLHCAALMFDAIGSPPLVHHKLVPTAAERYLWGCGDGSTMPVLHVRDLRVGSAICWENLMPLFRTAMYAKGVDLWCAPTVDDRDTWLATMRHVALEGRCFVLSACQYVVRDDYPSDVRTLLPGGPDDVLIHGGSVIVSPLGEVLAGPLHDGEGVLYAELDPDELARARMDLDVVGHYARPDVFRLMVDERPRRSVVRSEA